MANFFEELLGVSKKKSGFSAGAILGDILRPQLSKIPVVGPVVSDVVGGIAAREAQKEADKQSREIAKAKAAVFNPGIIAQQRTTKTVARSEVGRPTAPFASQGGIAQRKIPLSAGVPLSSRTAAVSSRPGVGKVVPVAPRVTLRPGSPSRAVSVGQTQRAQQTIARRELPRGIGDLSVQRAVQIGAGVGVSSAAAQSARLRLLTGGGLASAGSPVGIAQQAILNATRVAPTAGRQPIQVTRAVLPAGLGTALGRFGAQAGAAAAGELAARAIGGNGVTNGVRIRNGVLDLGIPGPSPTDIDLGRLVGTNTFGLDEASGQLFPILDGGLIATPTGIGKPVAIFKRNPRTGKFRKVKRRRMNPLNFKALSRASRRMEGFERLIMRNFRCTTGTMKPKKRRVTRRRRAKK